MVKVINISLKICQNLCLVNIIFSSFDKPKYTVTAFNILMIFLDYSKQQKIAFRMD